MDELIDFLKREDVKRFIKENVNADINQLILNPPSNFKERIKDIASQILARQKAKGKLDNWADNYQLIMPPPLSIEQASSQTTCTYKKGLVSGNHLLDLTGGMGIDFLAMSESFSSSTYVEKEALLCQIFQHNADILNSNAEVINNEAFEFLANLDSSIKPVVYLDPARRDQNKSKVFKIEDCSPDLVVLLPVLKQKAARILIKYSPMLDIKSVLKVLPGIKDIHIVSVKNETKELLILVDFQFRGTPTIHCVNLESGQSSYSFGMDEEKSASIELSDVDAFLFEPNSSIMKAGAFKKVALDFGLRKLAENTHLYTVGVPNNKLPGRVFKVLANADSKSIKEYALEGKINVISRNHPLSPTEIKKKWKLKDGGSYFLIAFRDQANKAKMIIAERLHHSK